ncbi:MAG: YchJ family metal-binding protein [Polyangiaceae bacterium]
MPPIRPSAPCPCNSTKTYGACCQPYHRGLAEAPDAEALMRSRYAAFAAGEYAYLWRTLHADHPDREYSEEQVISALRQTTQRVRYMGLKVLEVHPPDAQGIARVLFHARLFEKGKDCSFTELSDFLHDGTGWRYLAGDIRDDRSE